MKSALLMLMILLTSPVLAASNEDALIEQLEASGKLDAAVDRAIERYVAKQRAKHDADEKAQQDAQNASAKKVRPLDKSDRIHGAEQAKFSIIVWSDPECPYCKRFAGIPQQVADESDGVANASVRLLPLPFHGPVAIEAALTAICVADQAGAAAYYRFFDSYLNATEGNGKGIPNGKGAKSRKSVTDKLIREAGATDAKRMADCIKSDVALKKLQLESEEAGEIGVNGTPTIILRNNETGDVELVGGAVPAELLIEKVRALAGKTKTQTN